MNKVETKGVQNPALDEQWTQWVAYNLSSGNALEEVKQELLNNDFSDAAAESLIESVRQSPIFAAAQQHQHEVSKWCVLMDALHELESQTFSFSKVQRVSNLSSEEFHEKFYSCNRPVIITDVVKDWPATSKWTLDYLRETYGDQVIRYQSGRSDGDFDKTFQNNEVKGTFASYIDLISQGEKTNDYYLIAHDRMLSYLGFSNMLDDLNFDERYFGTKMGSEIFFWLGPEGSTTHMHRDLGNVLFSQISGRKQVKLISPKQSHYVYNNNDYYSDVNFDDYSVEEFPLLANADVITEVIEPGELLFIPVGWWHFVKSLDITISITTASFRFNNDLPKIF